MYRRKILCDNKAVSNTFIAFFALSDTENNGVTPFLF